MTRKEEIRAEMSKIAGTPPDWNKNDCMRMGFYEGAKWADKTMPDKVCKWLEEYVHYAVLDKKIELAGVELSEDLRKSMLE